MAVVYPNSTPVVVRTDTGVDIINVVGDDLSTPTVIQRSVGYTVALITHGSGGNAVRLPSDAEVGDVVECHGMSSGHTAVRPPDSETINGSSSAFNFIGGVIIRKVSETDWRSL